MLIFNKTLIDIVSNHIVTNCKYLYKITKVFKKNAVKYVIHKIVYTK